MPRFNIEVGTAEITFSLQVENMAETTFTYQWQRNGVQLNSGVAFDGVRTSRLRVLNIQIEDEGLYRCIVTNSNGLSIASNVARLTIQSSGKIESVHIFTL